MWTQHVLLSGDASDEVMTKGGRALDWRNLNETGRVSAWTGV